jgi:hypothetical protein
MFNTLSRDYEGPACAIHLRNGWSWILSASETPVCTIILESSQALHLFVAESN